MNWGLLAKTHAVHPPHADRPGACTWVAVEDGWKKWDIALPPVEVAEDEAASPDAYGAEMTGNRNFKRGWRWVSVLLGPGSMMYVSVLSSFCQFPSYLISSAMRPGLVHSVTTLQTAVAVGGHFFSFSTMKYSLYSILHTFVGSNSITNVSMDVEQQMILRIAPYFHRSMLEGEQAYMARIRAAKGGK